jgi:tetratricopeptide (TPR) repeat protein
MRAARHAWQPRDPRCCDCGRRIDVVRRDGSVSAGAAIMPEFPGAVCDDCVVLAEGRLVNDFKAEAAVHFLHGAAFELKTVDAVQNYLDLYGWEPVIVAAGAMRLHADGKPRDAFALLKAARGHGSAGFYDVERAALLLVEGETGQAHDLLAATTAADHPRWHHWNGVLAHSVGRPEAAVEHWRLQLETHPEDFESWLPLGFHLMQDRQDYAAAEDHFRRAVERHPRHQEFRAWLGDALLRQGRRDEALRELEAARDLEPVDPRFAQGIAALIASIEAGEV